MTERIIGGDWFKIRERILERDEECCQNCHENSNLTVHHVVPLENGGTNRFSNLITLCRSCHHEAHGQRFGVNDYQQLEPGGRRILSVSEAKKLLVASKHPLAQAVFVMLAKTGIGVGELCNLDIDDVAIDQPTENPLQENPETPYLRVRYGGSIPNANKRARFGTTVLPIDDELLHYIRRWMLIRPDTDSNALFTKTAEKWGERLDPDSLRYILSNISENCREHSQLSINPSDFQTFFSERYPGDPFVRRYLLTGLMKEDVEWKRISADYRENIFTFISPNL